MTWTKKDRVMAVLSGEIPDRIPVFDCLQHDGILENYGGSKIRAYDVEGHIRACSACLDLNHPTGGPREPGDEVRYDGTRIVNERWTTWQIPPFRTLDQLANQVKREIEEKESYKPSEEDVRKYKEYVAKANIWAGDMVQIHIGTVCTLLPGTIEEGFYLNTDEPELCERWFKACYKAELRRLDAIADPKDSPVIICWNDLGIKGQLLYPPDLLAKLFYPYLMVTCDLIHSKGIKVLFHSDGNITRALESIANCGIDGLNPLETTAGMDYKYVKEKYGKRFALVGGLDAVSTLAHGSVDEVIEETRHLISIAGRDGGFISGSASGEIDNSMPYENVKAYFETIWEFGRYK